MVDLIWIVALVGFAIWWYVLADLDKAGILKKYNMTAMGPIVMIRTFKGQKLLDWIAKPKGLWRALMLVGIPLVFASMVFMLVMFIGMDIMMLLNLETVPAPGPVNEPQNIIAIPGINQFIPFWWGWVALIIAMAAHEFGHAILAKVEDIKVNSLGIMLAPVPVGAFAEIDEEQLFGAKSESKAADILGPMETKAPGEGKRKATSRQMTSILSAGVVANFLVAFIAFGLLFGPVLGSIAASANDVVVYDVAPGSDAYAAGVRPNMIVTSVDGRPVAGVGQFDDYVRSSTNKNVTISGLLDNKAVSYSVPTGGGSGVYITDIVNDDRYPAKAAGLGPNMRIVAMNGTPICNKTDFFAYMNHTAPGQAVLLGLAYSNGTQMNKTIVLGQGGQGQAYIGIYSTDNPLGIAAGSFASGYLSGLKNMPFTLTGWLRIFILPVLQFGGDDPGFSIFQGQFSSLFRPIGLAAPFGTLVYNSAECLFWIGWLNLNVGLFNCLPMIPLDGGHVFREVVRRFLEPFIKDPARKEYVCGTIVKGFAVTLLAAILFMMLAPYIVHWLM